MVQNYISVFPDLSYKLHDNAQDALKEQSVFVAYYQRETFNTFYQTRDKFSYTIVDRMNQPFILNVGNWEIDTKSIHHYYYYYNRLDFHLTDPRGETRQLNIPALPPKNIETILNLLTYLNQFEGFDSWKHYELHLENQKLKDEIKTLKQL